MDSLQRNKAAVWNERLGQCLSNNHLTQAMFANVINEKYNTSFGQKDVSRWLNVGNKQGKNNIGFPRYETMIIIADYFNVSIGYLTGETDNETFTMEKACSFLALKQSAVQTIRDLTKPDSLNSLSIISNMRDSINQLFSSIEFKELLLHMCDLYSVTHPYKQEKFEYVEGAMDYGQDINESINLAQFNTWEAFFKLLEKLYPYSETFDFLGDND